MTHTSNKRAQTFILCMLLIALVGALPASAQELRRTFLLEVGARYEVTSASAPTWRTPPPWPLFTSTQTEASTSVPLSSAEAFPGPISGRTSP